MGTGCRLRSGAGGAADGAPEAGRATVVAPGAAALRGRGGAAGGATGAEVARRTALRGGDGCGRRSRGGGGRAPRPRAAGRRRW
jgi:hypothetical protein